MRPIAAIYQFMDPFLLIPKQSSARPLILSRTKTCLDIICTVCPKGPVKKYLPIARARKQPITLDGCHFHRVGPYNFILFLQICHNVILKESLINQLCGV